MPDEGLYSIGVVARLTGLHDQTIRQYEKLGLIRPQRSPGGTRLFSETDLRLLTTIASLTRDMGVNIAGVEIILKMRKRHRQLLDLAREMFSQLDDETRSRFESKLRGDEPGLVPTGPGGLVRSEKQGGKPKRKIEIEDGDEQ